MSRIGKKNIQLSKEVTLTISPTNVVTVKGPRGSLSQTIDPAITLQIQGDQVILTRATEQKRHKALHGLYRALVQNMVTGVTQGYKKSLELHGVGYKVSLQKDTLELHLGYSHPIYFVLPPEITAQVEAKKGQSSTVHLISNDKQLLGKTSAVIKSTRVPEPYKGKGIRFVGEIIRRKVGKKVTK